MNLVEALQAMRRAGFVQAKDTHSHFFKEIKDLLAEAELDLNDYTPKPDAREIVQNHSRPSVHYECR